MKTALALFAGVAIAIVVVACGGPMRGAAPPSTSERGGMPVPAGGSPHQQIEALSADITANLDRIAAPQPEPFDVASGTVDPRTADSIAEAVCTPPAHPPGSCGDVCTVSTHICDNATQICKLADDLQPDDWSKGKCEDGKQSCEAGRKKCCDCT